MLSWCFVKKLSARETNPLYIPRSSRIQPRNKHESGKTLCTAPSARVPKNIQVRNEEETLIPSILIFLVRENEALRFLPVVSQSPTIQAFCDGLCRTSQRRLAWQGWPSRVANWENILSQIRLTRRIRVLQTGWVDWLATTIQVRNFLVAVDWGCSALVHTTFHYDPSCLRSPAGLPKCWTEGELLSAIFFCTVVNLQTYHVQFYIGDLLIPQTEA